MIMIYAYIKLNLKKNYFALHSIICKTNFKTKRNIQLRTVKKWKYISKILYFNRKQTLNDKMDSSTTME